MKAKSKHMRRSSSATKKLLTSKPQDALTLPEAEQFPDSISEISPNKTVE